MKSRSSSSFRASNTAFWSKSAGWSEAALYDAITVCALFQFYNTWIDATGVHDLPASVYGAMGERMAAHGYAPPE